MILSIIFIVIAAISKAAMDVLSFNYYESIFSNINDQYFNPSISWANKWDDNGSERFLFSSTLLVFLTDGWHLFQFLFLSFMFGALVVYTPFENMVIDFLILRIVFGLVFELFYDYVFLIKKSK